MDCGTVGTVKQLVLRYWRPFDAGLFPVQMMGLQPGTKVRMYALIDIALCSVVGVAAKSGVKGEPDCAVMIAPTCHPLRILD